MAKKEKKNESEKVDSFTIRNWQLKLVTDIWLTAPQHGEKAIARNRVVKLLGEKFEAYEADRLQLIEKHGKRDAEKQLVVSVTTDPVTGKESSQYVMEDELLFQKEFAELSNAEAVFDLLPSNRTYWRTVREIIKSSTADMDIETTDLYEELLEALKNA